MNAEPGSEVIEIMDQHFTRSCRQCPPTIPATHPTKVIDFITFSPQAAFKIQSHTVIHETYASDHLPVLSVLQFKGER